MIIFLVAAVMAHPSAFCQDDSNNTVFAAVGLPQPDSADFAKIVFADILFGAIGFFGLVYGKKNRLWWTMIIGFALIAYPYFLSGALAIYLVGIALTVALYFCSR